MCCSGTRCLHVLLREGTLRCGALGDIPHKAPRQNGLQGSAALSLVHHDVLSLAVMHGNTGQNAKRCSCNYWCIVANKVRAVHVGGSLPGLAHRHLRLDAVMVASHS